MGKVITCAGNAIVTKSVVIKAVEFVWSDASTPLDGTWHRIWSLAGWTAIVVTHYAGAPI